MVVTSQGSNIKGYDVQNKKVFYPNTDYIADENGLLYVYGLNHNLYNGELQFIIDGVKLPHIYTSVGGADHSIGVPINFPIKKGQRYKVYAYNMNAGTECWFIPEYK